MLNTIWNGWKMASFPFWICIGPLLMNFLYGSKIQYGHQHRKKIWSGQWGIFLLWWRSSLKPLNQLNVNLHGMIGYSLFVILCKGYVFLHQSEIKDGCPCLTLFVIGKISKKSFLRNHMNPNCTWIMIWWSLQGLSI